MRCLLVVALLSAVAYGQKPKFDKKVTSLVTTYLGPNEPKATDLVVSYLVAQQTWDQIMDNLMKNAIGLVPANKYLPSMGMLTSFTSCLKSTGVTMEDAMKTISAAFKKILTPPYTKIIKKMKEMAKAKKNNAQMSNQAYTIATSALTKALVQKMIDAAKKASTEPAWKCAKGPLDTVMLTKLYNMAWSKSG